MRYTFSANQENIPVCLSGEAETDFAISQDPRFQNRDYRFHGDGFLFDGYSHWFRGKPHFLTEGESFTFTLSFLPVTYSSHPDGLFTFFQKEANRGIEILLEQGGIITVNLGFGKASARLSSIRAQAQAGVWNIVTVVYRGDAGWCDLYVNGVLSNRRQFPRHTSLSFPESCPYIGRRMDGDFYTEEVPFGCFYGYMNWVELDEGQKDEEEILALHRSVYTGTQEAETFMAAMPQRKTYCHDRNRPVYHLSPEGKWMNEPHGPMYYDGWYHIFYQANPHAPIWDHLCWGHLKSRDMIRWQSCPLALIPEKEENAPHGCWSGSSVIDKEGKPRIYFTAGNDNCFPNQAVALATPEAGLDIWHTRPQLVQEQDMGWMGEFRDPFVWLEGDTYFMLVGSGDAHNGGGNAILYSSTDGLHWDNHGFLVDYDFDSNQEVGHIWELPVLLPLKDETGKVVCHILLLCAAQVETTCVEVYYFLGDWEPEKRRFTKHHEKAALLDLGKGVFTGPSGFVTPDGRSVVFTIAQGKRPFLDEVHAGWAHNGGLPAELSIRKGQLDIRPIHETESLRKVAIPVSSNDDLKRHPGDTLCLEYSCIGDRASVILCYGQQQKEVYYDRHTHRLGLRDENGMELGVWRGEADNVDLGDEPISFTCYLDHSMLEVYLNGRKAVSTRNYTGGSRYFQITGEPASLALWEMDSAYHEDSTQ